MQLQTLVPTKLTPEEVFTLWQDQYRHWVQLDCEVDWDFEPKLNSTVAEWRDACDLGTTRRLAENLNFVWQTEIPSSQWQAVLEPAKQRTLGEVCTFLADRITSEVVKPPALLGAPCPPAGVFFAVREILARAGADITGLHPSTRLEAYTGPYLRSFIGPISQLAPGALPVTKHANRVAALWGKAFLSSLLVFAKALFTAAWTPLLWILPGLAALISFLAMIWASESSKWRSFTFGELETFRDLCVTLAPKLRKEREAGLAGKIA